MVFVGIFLVVVAVGAGADILAGSTGAASLSVFGWRLPGVTTQADVFILGVVFTLILAVGVVVTVLGAGRLLRVRRELRALREGHQESLNSLEMEKRELERELARARSATTRTAGQSDDLTAADLPSVPRSRPIEISPEGSPFFERS